MNRQDSISVATIMALKAGDERAFHAIYLHFGRRLYGNLLKLVHSEELARELLQDVFVKVWEKRASIDPEKSFRSYLFQIAENRAYDFFRKVSRDRKLQAHLLAHFTRTYTHVEELLLKKEYDDLLQQAISALPPRRQQVFRLCKLEGKSYEEAAIQLGISIATISDHLVKATRFVRTYLYAHYSLLVPLYLCVVFKNV